MLVAPRLTPLLLALASGGLAGCGEPEGRTVGQQRATPPTAAASDTSASPADQAIEACLRATYAVGREGVRRASCDVRVTWDRRYFREPIQFSARFEFADGKGSVRWTDRQGDPDLAAEIARLFEPNWLRSDLAAATLTVVAGKSPVTLLISGANPLHATSLTFGPEESLAAAVLRTECDGVEREGTRTFLYEPWKGRRNLVRHSVGFGDACSDETTIKWSEREGLLLPTEIRRHIAAGKEHDDERLELLAWDVEREPGN